jgi:hypothetical protein
VVGPVSRSSAPSDDELAADIARTREELAATVSQLQAQAKATAVSAGKRAGIVLGVVAVVGVAVLVVRKVRS